MRQIAKQRSQIHASLQTSVGTYTQSIVIPRDSVIVRCLWQVYADIAVSGSSFVMAELTKGGRAVGLVNGIAPEVISCCGLGDEDTLAIVNSYAVLRNLVDYPHRRCSAQEILELVVTTSGANSGWTDLIITLEW